MEPLSTKLKRAWNVFKSKDNLGYERSYKDYGPSYGSRRSPDSLHRRGSIASERTIIASIITRIAVDVTSVDIRHVYKDKDGRYLRDADSGLNNCLALTANVDQTGRAFRQDFVMTMLEEGCAIALPTDTDVDATNSNTFDILTMRVGTAHEWYPYHVRVNAYREKNAQQEQVIVPKSMVGIVENPFYSVMNEPNSTLKRLVHKLNLLDILDNQISSGKLDLIIQLPYTIKSDAKREQAEQRRKDIEVQLTGSQYGIAYTDGTEKITQLNRPAENHLWQQVKDLKDLLYAELGVTPQVMDGTADEATMLNYYNRTVNPILDAIQEEFERKFITKTGRTQGQAIDYFRNPFKLVPMEKMAEMADKFTRNEILSSNELRSFIGIKPSQDPKADELHNSNMPRVDPEPAALEDPNTVEGEVVSDTGWMDEALSELESQVDKILSEG